MNSMEKEKSDYATYNHFYFQSTNSFFYNKSLNKFDVILEYKMYITKWFVVVVVVLVQVKNKIELTNTTK